MWFLVFDGAISPRGYISSVHILTLTPFYPTASDDAAGCFIAEPLRVMREFGVESCTVAVRAFYKGRMHPNPTAPSANWIRYPCIPSGIGLASAGAFLYTRLISKVRKLHRSQRIDLIHAHSALPCGHAAVLLSQELRIPCVVTVHGLDAFFGKQVRGFSGERCKRISQFVYRSASRVICISDNVADQVMQGAAAPVNTTVIYNGVDSGLFSPSGNNLVPATMLSVGNLIPIKSHELLLRAVAAIQPRYPNLSLEIIGDGPERSRLTRLAADLNLGGRVHLLGRQSRNQVAEAMRRCEIFALPSRYEGLGCVYLEAMSSEKPTIACRGQGIEEIIRHATNGWLIRPDDLAGLIDGLSQLLQSAHLRQQIGSAARRTILQGLTLTHQAARLAEVYRECSA
jgi:teichuronic acid biosynthesis glycosyltransferase TuaC